MMEWKSSRMSKFIKLMANGFRNMIRIPLQLIHLAGAKRRSRKASFRMTDTAKPLQLNMVSVDELIAEWSR